MVVKVEELRIGNIVQTQNALPYIIYIDDLNGIEIDGLKFEQMPLTDEWLVKFGFEITEDEHGFKDANWGTNPITTDWLLKLKTTSEGWFYRNGFFKINYVHQLQNLYYSLTGKELINPHYVV